MDASAILPGTDVQVRDELQRAIETVAGDIRMERYEAVRDSKNKLVAYKVWGHR